MSRIAAGLALAFLCAAAAFTDEPEKKPAAGPIECELRLRDGQKVIGTTSASVEIAFKTKEGVRKFALGDIWSLKLGKVAKEELDSLMTGKGTITGELQDLDSLAVDTGFGILKVPQDRIAAIRILHPHGPFLLDFGSGTLDGWKASGKSKWTPVDGGVQVQPAGPGDTLLFDEQFDGAYTIEAEVTFTEWAAILWNVGDGPPALAFWLFPGSASLYGNGSWTGTLVRTWPLESRRGGTSRVKLEIDGAHIKVNVDGKFLGEWDGPSTSGRIGFGCWTKEATFRNVRITR